jgi:hypothetical protein
MSLNESIVEDAALECFLHRSAPLNFGGQVGELGGRRVKIEIGRVKFWEPFPISFLTLHSFSCEAIWRLNFSIPEEARELSYAENTDHLKCAWEWAQRNL